MDIMDFGIAAIPAITVICFLIAEVVKQTPLDKAWIPAICGVCGAVLGVAAFYLSPNLIPANDVLSAVAIGIVSGFAATGVHQVYKQIGEKM